MGKAYVELRLGIQIAFWRRHCYISPLKLSPVRIADVPAVETKTGGILVIAGAKLPTLTKGRLQRVSILNS